MKTFKIEIPEGHEVDVENSTYELITFKKIEKKEVRCFKDLDKTKGYYIPSNTAISGIGSMSANKGSRNIWPTLELAQASLALSQLCQLRDRVNNGWKPDWKDCFEEKRVLFSYKSEIIKGSAFLQNYTLAFQTEEDRNTFLTNHRELIETAKPLL